MSDTAPVLPCPACQTLNRVDAARRAAATCGRCGAALMPRAPFALDSSAFARHAQHSSLPLVVDFWAPWCGPCVGFAPVFARIAAELGDRARFAKVDTEAEPELAARYAIRSIPTLAVFRDGREVARLSGALPYEQFRAWLGQAGV